jgi:enoyl-CoA hydratase/3-hydroxyacyl-CoA dehydrogenase
LELALACHRIVTGPKAKFCFPETGLGIYPGMGGTQRLPRRIGVGLAKWMIYTGAIVPADHAARFGLADAATTANALPPDAVAALERAGEIPTYESRDRLLAELFSRNKVADLLDPARPLPTEPWAVRAIVQLRAAAPCALRLAEAAIDQGISLPLSAGIEEEFSRLSNVFSTTDARLGLAALGQTKPRFTGS